MDQARLMAKPKKTKQSKNPKSLNEISKLLAYPLWAKLIVCLVILGGAACFLSFTYFMHNCVTIVRQATDPAYVQASLKKLAGIDKLPSGFKAEIAASVFNSSMLKFTYEPDNSNIMLWYLSLDDKRRTARQLADSMAETGIPTISDEFKVEKKGSLPVAGQPLEYVAGVTSSKQGLAFGGFIGCALFKDKQALLVYGWTPPKSTKQKQAASPSSGEPAVTFNMGAVTNLLAAIKSI